MPYIVRDLPALLTVSSSGGTTAISGTVGHLDDASSLTVYFTTSASLATSTLVLQVSMFDPADKFPITGVTQSSQFYNISSSNIYTSGSAVSINNISFRGLRATFTATSSSNGETVAFVTKQISV